MRAASRLIREKLLLFWCNRRFILGVILLVANFIVGKLALLIIPLDVLWAAIVYGISWVMLFLGLFMCGREGYELSKLYYHQFKSTMKTHTQNRLSIRAANDDE